MIYTEQTKKALKLCFEAHKEQLDQSGMLYVFHPFHVAKEMDDEETTVVALLHDVIEDTDYTLDDLRNMGFSGKVVEAVEVMTHLPEVSYEDYLRNIKRNPIAKKVKFADVRHNSDQTRLDVIDEKAEYWKKKYTVAYQILCEE